MKNNRVLFFCVMICVSLLGACSVRHQYVPELHPLDSGRFGALDAIKIDKQVSIINSQESKEEFLLGEDGVHDYYGSLHDITESAVKHAKAELAKRQVDIDIVDDPEKLLNLRVTSAKMVRGMWVVRAIIDMDIVTGSGLARTYHIENVSPISVQRAYSGAAAIGVIEMFSDIDVLKYLSESE